MNNQQAIYLLHPDTTREALQEKSHEESIKLIEKACILACEALENYNLWTPATIPPESGERVCVYYETGGLYWTDFAIYYTKQDVYWEDVENDGFYRYDSEYGYFEIKNVLFWSKIHEPSKKVINNILNKGDLQ